jgi:hypothetical protein
MCLHVGRKCARTPDLMQHRSPLPMVGYWQVAIPNIAPEPTQAALTLD